MSTIDISTLLCWQEEGERTTSAASSHRSLTHKCSPTVSKFLKPYTIHHILYNPSITHNINLRTNRGSKESNNEYYRHLHTRVLAGGRRKHCLSHISLTHIFTDRFSISKILYNPSHPIQSIDHT